MPSLPTIQVHGYEFAHDTRGDGVPVVFVHGSSSDYRTWRAQMDPVGQSFRAVAYSRRYHRPNVPIADDAPYSMAEQVDDLETFLSMIGDQPTHLVGHSYGGYLALLVAMRKPGLVRTLTLQEPPVIPLFVNVPPNPRQLLKVFVTRPRTGAAVVRLAAKGFGPAAKAAARNDIPGATRLVGTAILGRKFFEQLSPDRLDQAEANFIKAEAVRPDYLPLDQAAIADIAVPVLLVGGSLSPRLFHLLTDRLSELMPASERVSVPSASHLAHEDNPAAYNAALTSFLARH